jgi:hypothetical protein
MLSSGTWPGFHLGYGGVSMVETTPTIFGMQWTGRTAKTATCEEIGKSEPA